MTREEHLKWCKDRAKEYAMRGDYTNAVTSMMSDMNKHPETKITSPVLTMLGMQAAISHDQSTVLRFIDGFN